MLHHITYKHKDSSEWITFVHGAGGSSSIWFKQVREFRKYYNVLLLDLRGHGKSKKPIYEKLRQYSFDVIGDDVIEVLNHLKIRSSHFIGISLGTIIIRELAERHPQRIKTMILGGAVMKLNLRGQFLMRLGVLLKSIVPYLILYKLLAFVVMPRKNHKESRLLFVNEAKKLYQKEFVRWFSLTARINPLLKLFRIKDSGIPTLYLMGAQDYMFLPSISKLVQEHRSSLLEVIPNCGHVVNVERASHFNRSSIAFIQKNV